MGAGVGAAFIIEGGTLNFAGRLTSANTFITYTQSGGTVNICTAGGCATSPSFGFTGATGVVMKMSGGDDQPRQQQRADDRPTTTRPGRWSTAAGR